MGGIRLALHLAIVLHKVKLYHTNSPDDIWITRRALPGESLPTAPNCPWCVTTQTSPTGPYDISFTPSLTTTVNFTQPVEDDMYLYIRLINNSGNIIKFKGGYMLIEPIP